MKRRISALCCAALPIVVHAQITATGPIDRATRAEVIEEVSQQILKHYIFLDQGQAMVAAIHQRQQNHEYDSLNDGLSFAARLNADLQTVSHDKHMEVGYSLPPIPVSATENTVEADAKARTTLPQKPPTSLKWPSCKTGSPQNFGFGSAECLPGNIGLLKLHDHLPPSGEAMPVLAAAMNSFGNTRMLIIDVRQGYGGDSDTVFMLESYLFDHATPMDDFYFRDVDKTLHKTSIEKVEGKKYGQKKGIYVLTGRLTFSSHENLAYDLQATRRATVVGEKTVGGAHHVAVFRINEHFDVHVPNGNTVNAITKASWDGTGVIPDVAVNETDALNVAQVLALKKIMQTERNAVSLAQLRQRVQELQGMIVSPEAVKVAR